MLIVESPVPNEAPAINTHAILQFVTDFLADSFVINKWPSGCLIWTEFPNYGKPVHYASTPFFSAPNCFPKTAFFGKRTINPFDAWNVAC
jgi:hypothetical protein